MKKRMTALALVCMLSLASLVGCGGGSGDSASSDKVKIGGLAPLTGNLSIYGTTTDNGIKMAIEEVNAAGGVLGKQIDYICYDEKGDATEAVNAYNKLMQSDKIDALIGDVTSGPSIAVAQQAAKDGIPMISATGTAVDITKAGENVFRVCFIDPYQGETMADYAVKKLNAKSAAVLYNTSDDYSVGLMEAFTKTADELGLKIVAKESYAKGDVDFKSQLTKIAGQNPDVLFIPVYYEDVALIAQQAKSAGVKAQMLGADGWDGVLGKVDDKSVLENAMYCSGFSVQNQDQAVQDFVKKYTDKYGDTPTGFAAQGYDAAKLLVQAIEKAGSTDKAAVVEAMKSIEYNGVTGKIVFDEERNPIKGVIVNKLTGGNIEYVESYEKTK